MGLPHPSFAGISRFFLGLITCSLGMISCVGGISPCKELNDDMPISEAVKIRPVRKIPRSLVSSIDSTPFLHRYERGCGSPYAGGIVCQLLKLPKPDLLSGLS